jgi:hypothetical protein
LGATQTGGVRVAKNASRRAQTCTSNAQKFMVRLTVAGVISHQSALKGGELLKIPQFT